MTDLVFETTEGEELFRTPMRSKDGKPLSVYSADGEPLEELFVAKPDVEWRQKFQGPKGLPARRRPGERVLP